MKKLVMSQSLGLEELRSVINVKISVKLQCKAHVKLHLLHENLVLRCKTVKVIRNFLVVKNSGYSFIIFIKRNHRSLHVNVTGIPALHYVGEAVHSLVHLFRSCSISVVTPTRKNTTIDSISSKWKLEPPVDLNLLQRNSHHNHSVACRFEVQRFPGASISHISLGSAVVFNSGVVLLWGQKQLAQQLKLVNIIRGLV